MPLLQPSAGVSLKDACSIVGHERIAKRLLRRGFWPQIACDHGATILFMCFKADFMAPEKQSGIDGCAHLAAEILPHCGLSKGA